MSKRRVWVLVIAGLFFAIAFLTSMGTFDNRPYSEVPHGDHTHYVPKDCDPPLSVSQSPTQKPGPGEMVDCAGRIVPMPATP